MNNQPEALNLQNNIKKTIWFSNRRILQNKTICTQLHQHTQQFTESNSKFHHTLNVVSGDGCLWLPLVLNTAIEHRSTVSKGVYLYCKCLHVVLFGREQLQLIYTITTHTHIDKKNTGERETTPTRPTSIRQFAPSLRLYLFPVCGLCQRVAPRRSTCRKTIYIYINIVHTWLRLVCPFTHFGCAENPHRRFALEWN